MVTSPVQRWGPPCFYCLWGSVRRKQYIGFRGISTLPSSLPPPQILCWSCFEVRYNFYVNLSLQLTGSNRHRWRPLPEQMMIQPCFSLSFVMTTWQSYPVKGPKG